MRWMRSIGLALALGCGADETETSPTSAPPTRTPPAAVPVAAPAEAPPIEARDARSTELATVASALVDAGAGALRIGEAHVVIGDGTALVLCSLAASETCEALPLPGRLGAIFEGAHGVEVTVVLAGGHEVWRVDEAAHRVTRSHRWVPSRTLSGAATRRAEAPHEARDLTTVPRPPALRHLMALDDGHCVPRLDTVTHTTAGRGAEIAVAGCEDRAGDGDGQPQWIRIATGAEDARPWTARTTLLPADGVVELDVDRVLSVLPDAVVFVEERRIGSSPSGGTDEAVTVARFEGEAVQLQSFVVSETASEGLGTGDSGEYEVEVVRRRLDYELLVAEGARVPSGVHVSGCEGFAGVHLRASDRWRGRSCEDALDVTVPLEASGFAEAPEALRACCPSNAP